MRRRLQARALAAPAVGLALAAALGGCGAAARVSITNLSDAGLGVRFFTAESGRSDRLLSARSFRVGVGETATFHVERRRDRRSGRPSPVHVELRPLTPVWNPPGLQYWLELLGSDPVGIVARGEEGRLRFDAAPHQVAPLPDKHRHFDYAIAE